MTLKTSFQKLIQQYGLEYYNIQTVRLGKQDGHTVLTGIDGLLWARQWNGREIQVINQAMVAGDWDKRVLVGIKRNQPGKWFILESMEDYLVPTSGGRIGYHEKQHEFGQPDMVPIDRKQLTVFSIVVSDATAWEVQLYGGVFQSLTRMTIVSSAVYDLSAYVTTTDAYYVAFHVDDDGVITLVQGTSFGDPLAGGADYIPVPDPGKYIIGYVMFYQGQSTLLDDDIRCFMPLTAIPKTAAYQIGEAPIGVPSDTDLVPFYDTGTSALNELTWSSFLQLITDWVAPQTISPAVARWNGITGQTTFDLPDIAEVIYIIAIAGAVVDPLVYSLSADHTQIVLDTGLASDSVVTTYYILRKL